MSLHKGWDYLTTPPGEKSLLCPVCSEEMVVQRQHFGPQSWAGAMAGPSCWQVHDLFTCVHANEPWHERARALRQLIAETPSQRIRALVEAELRELLEQRAED